MWVLIMTQVLRAAGGHVAPPASPRRGDPRRAPRRGAEHGAARVGEGSGGAEGEMKTSSIKNGGGGEA